jgi:hypothetical protein
MQTAVACHTYFGSIVIDKYRVSIIIDTYLHTVSFLLQSVFSPCAGNYGKNQHYAYATH